jgi:site-specific recombinase XerC
LECNLDAGVLQPMVGSFELHLRAEKKSPKTVRTYIEATQWLAAEYLVPAGVSDWSDVKARHVQEWTVTPAGPLLRRLRQQPVPRATAVLKWHATEDSDELRPNPVANLKPPKVGDKTGSRLH